jgi:hypothetical protein
MALSLLSSTGSYSKRRGGSGIVPLTSYMIAFQNLIISKPPWAMYSAESFADDVLVELRNTSGRNASTTGTITKSSDSGNGATASIPFISGSTTSSITFPAGSIPTNFTICSITRYTDADGASERILATPDHSVNNWLHGHHQNKRGVVFYNDQLAPFTNNGTTTDWVVVCGKSGGTAPGNIVIDNVASGNANGGGTSDNQMAINVWTLERSDYALSQLFIWDQALTDAELLVVSNALTQHLVDGVSFTNAL